MRAYAAQGSNASGTSNKTLVTVIGSTTVRPAVSEFVVGCSASPSDTAVKVALNHFSAVGTAGASPTPRPLDPSDVAAVATCGNGHSAEPTYTANSVLKQIPMNSRGTFRYVASPGYEFKGPATASNGIGLYLVSASAAIVMDGDVSWYE